MKELFCWLLRTNEHKRPTRCRISDFCTPAISHTLSFRLIQRQRLRLTAFCPLSTFSLFFRWIRIRCITWHIDAHKKGRLFSFSYVDTQNRAFFLSEVTKWVLDLKWLNSFSFSWKWSNSVIAESWLTNRIGLAYRWKCSIRYLDN